jgi:DNA-binding XRE family transcriptional regulator
MAKTPSPPRTHNQLGELIRSQRESAKMTRMQFAANTGIHVVTLTKIELGNHDPSLWALSRMIDMLNLDPSEVFKAIDRRR